MAVNKNTKSPFAGLSHGRSEPDPDLSDLSSSPLKQFRGLSPPAGKRGRGLSEVRKTNNTDKPLELKPFAVHENSEMSSSDVKIGTPVKTQDQGLLNYSEKSQPLSSSQQIVDKSKERRGSQFIAKSNDKERLFASGVTTTTNNELNDEGEENGDTSKRRKHKSYD